MKKALISIFFLAVLLQPLGAGAQGPIKAGQTLTLEQCIAVALGNNPAVFSARGAVQAARSRIGQTRSGYYPQIDWQGGYNRDSFTPAGNSRFASEGSNFTTGPTLNQTIYDFGRTGSQVNIAKFNLNSSSEDLENTSELVILSVKQAYYGVLQARRNRDVAKDVVKQYEDHLRQAKGFYEVGTKPMIDVTKAEADLSNARLSLIKADNSLETAWATLNNAMGVPGAPAYGIVDTLSYSKYSITFEDALNTAYKNRPDLKSALALKAASEQSVKFAKSGYYPVLTGTASYTWQGDSLPMDRGWSAGLNISIPVFNGFLTRYQVDESQANLSQADAAELSVRQQVFLDVRQAYLNLKTAGDSIPTAEIGVKQAKENLDLANGRYAAGVGSPIEISDALATYSAAETAYINALYNHKIARASLEKAMGIR